MRRDLYGVSFRNRGFSFAVTEDYLPKLVTEPFLGPMYGVAVSHRYIPQSMMSLYCKTVAGNTHPEIVVTGFQGAGVSTILSAALSTLRSSAM